MQIAEFSLLDRKRILSNHVVAINVAAYLLVTFFQAYFFFKLFVKPKISLLFFSHVSNILIAYTGINYYM